MSNNEINIKIRIRKKHLIVALIAVITTSLIIPYQYQIFAQNQSEERTEESVESVEPLAPLTSVVAFASNNAVEEKSWYLISFRTAISCTIRTVSMLFPNGYNVAGAKLIEKVNIGNGAVSVTGQEVKYTVSGNPPPSVAASTTISIMLSEIRNANAASYTVTVTTKNHLGVTCDGSTSSATFPLRQVGSSMIADGTILGADINSNALVRVGSLDIAGVPQRGEWNSRIPISNSLSTVDPIDDVGLTTSTTIGADGLPIISYYDATNRDLKVAKCNNATCTSSTKSTVDSTGDVGGSTSITIGKDGLPVISYVESRPPVTPGTLLKVARCNNAACTSSTITNLGFMGEFGGGFTSITIGADGLPIISFGTAFQEFASDLAVMKCNNAACTSGTLAIVDSSFNVSFFGLDSSITIGADGLPIISYSDGENGDLKVAKCNNAACTSSTKSTVDSTGDVGRSTSITIGADGLPIISYLDSTNNDLKVLHCNNTACTSGTASTVDSTGFVGSYTSIAIGTDGLPVVSYRDNTNLDLKVLHCNNTACTSGTASTVDSTGNVGVWTSIAIGTDGLPIISYYDAMNGDLKVAHCGSILCISNWTRR